MTTHHRPLRPPTFVYSSYLGSPSPLAMGLFVGFVVVPIYTYSHTHGDTIYSLV
ncbi:hypothetical protein BDN70DRAFT_878528, partial [Pholiota conissans]